MENFYRNNDKSLFRKYQKTLLEYANSEAGRHLLGIKDSRKIWQINPSSLHFFNGFVGKDLFSSEGQFYTWDRIADILLPILDKKEIALESALKRHDDRLVRRIIENPYESFLHFANLEIQNNKYPQIYLDTFTALTTGRGRVRNNNATYLTSRNATAGDGIFGDLGFLEHSDAGGSHIISRLFMEFQTSDIADNATLTAGQNKINFEAETPTRTKVNGNTDSIVIVDNTKALGSALANEDFDLIGGTSFGSMTIANFNDVAGSANEITLNATGEGNIFFTQNSRFALRMNGDLTATDPSADNSVGIQLSATVLTVTYTVVSPSSSVSPSISPSSSQSSSASASASPSGSASGSASQSASASASESKSLSPSSSVSASASSSESKSLSPSASASPSPSASASASESPSLSPSASLSPSISPSPSLSPSASASRSLSPSASGSASASRSQSPSASLSPSVSASASPSPASYTAKYNTTGNTFQDKYSNTNNTFSPKYTEYDDLPD